MGFVSYLMFFTIENPDVRMIEQLNMAKSEAERANMAKSDFLASMSHEIRTPLNAITGFSHAILNDETLSSESLEYANDIVKASNTLLEIVGGVLDVSKIESNKMDIVEVLYNPREEIEDLVKIVNARLGEKPVLFNYKVAEDLPYQLYGDRANMKKVVTNLLTNAVKYTSKGQIFFNVRCINKNDICHVVISVQDTGMGIKEEHISKLFTKFERLEVEKNTTAEGTGLGLAITKRLVELMGGKINVKSQYGVGSIFMTQIPQRIAMMSKPLTDTQILSTVELKNKRLKEEANIDGQRILIVDDNALNIKVAKIALKNFNLVLDEVESGEECLEKIMSGERYDLILMDIMMPGLSGEETFIELKKIVGFNTPVIALTADAVSGSKEKYLSQGFTSYISKPFSPEEIKLELAKIFKTKR
jgi:CheY-like chemotaxis protein/nitrogen-specific signal transduction histidine kinase